MQANVDGDESVAVGFSALYNMDPSGNTDMHNVAIGQSASYSCTVGIKNTSIGSQALYSDDTGSASVAIGYQAVYNQDT